MSLLLILALFFFKVCQHNNMYQNSISFLEVNNIPVDRHATMCLSRHPLLDFWTLSTF